MRSPAADIARDRIHDLWLEIKPEVVARCEIREPVITTPDAPAIDLVDDGVHHAVRRTQCLEVTALRQPAMEPRNPSVAHRTPCCSELTLSLASPFWTLGCLIGPNREILKAFREQLVPYQSFSFVGNKYSFSFS
jgi:hypothetical protein